MSQSINALISRIQRDLKINAGEMLSNEGKKQLREAIDQHLSTSEQEVFEGDINSLEFSEFIFSWGMNFASSCYYTDTYSTDCSKEMCDIIEKHLIEFGTEWISEQY